MPSTGTKFKVVLLKFEILHNSDFILYTIYVLCDSPQSWFTVFDAVT
jgi:hypothetical protein